MKKIALISLLGLAFSNLSFATETATISNELSPLYLGASGGYGNMRGTHRLDGRAAQERMVLGLHGKKYKDFVVGAELGLQSGNSVRLTASQSVINTAGGLPIQALLKPVADILLTLKTPEKSGFFGLFKGGIAYRQLQLRDRTSSQDSIARINGEFQGGVGYRLSSRATLNLMYQGIYSNADAGVALDANQDVTISHIPSQQAIFLGFEYTL